MAEITETKADKFIRIAQYRMNKAIDAIDRMETLANRNSYEYTEEQVESMFMVLQQHIDELRTTFKPKKTTGEKSGFSF